ncbi:Uncharacterised protein [Vibrio cholerae]|nr:Uncharacterised protein [Vibrio cholerae]
MAQNPPRAIVLLCWMADYCSQSPASSAGSITVRK